MAFHTFAVDAKNWTWSPVPGSRFVRHVGDFLTFSAAGIPTGWTVRVRTNLGRDAVLRREIVDSLNRPLPAHSDAWRDIPLTRLGDRWETTIALFEPGFFSAKAFVVDPNGRQHWAPGRDVSVAVHPNWTRTANTLYCAFPRQFGRNKSRNTSEFPGEAAHVDALDRAGYAVIPPSGKLRDLTRELPHIVTKLGCRILQLLPIHPTPTVYARFGRFGSPYALGDFTTIDPALVELDHRTTGLQQFDELVDGARSLGARVFLDLVINHTGWGSRVQEQHPEWFRREPDGRFASPGAWGTVWEDLVELDPWPAGLWKELAEAFLFWCRRGVAGFRCDAGYKLPLPLWRYITARVRDEFPDTVFLLEGLGGSWEATEALLGEGGMQWAYSELFQNHGASVPWYLDHAYAISARAGTLMHYSETHDNTRLAAHESGRKWSLHRNLLCGLTSLQGAYAFTNGVEWLATERVNVHSNRALHWDSPSNLIPELSALNQLISHHPCFFDQVAIERLSPASSTLLALARTSSDGRDSVLILANLDLEHSQTATVSGPEWTRLGKPARDLLTRQSVDHLESENGVSFDLGPGQIHCLGVSLQPSGRCGNEYRKLRAAATWGIQRQLESSAPSDPSRDFPPFIELGESIIANPVRHLLSTLPADAYESIVEWNEADVRRQVPIPPRHWVLFRSQHPFELEIPILNETGPSYRQGSIETNSDHVAAWWVGPDEWRKGASRKIILRDHFGRTLEGALVLLPPAPVENWCFASPANPIALLTNGRGAMARVHSNPFHITSKYDCLLGANLHPEVPVDRHVFIKRVRIWAIADEVLRPLDASHLKAWIPGETIEWHWETPAGDGRRVSLVGRLTMVPGKNWITLQILRPGGESNDSLPLRLAVRFDLEDRSYHGETERNEGSERHFTHNTRTFESKEKRVGFRFSPAPERTLEVEASLGTYHPEPEWCDSIAHPVEAGRGQTGAGAAWSPGWFEAVLPAKGQCLFQAGVTELGTGTSRPEKANHASGNPAPARCVASNEFQLLETALRNAVRAFVVRRSPGTSIIAGYPWFLDWGRDTLIGTRGLIAAGELEIATEILRTYGALERDGTLPNSLNGESHSNRDTSDAPLWFALATEELDAAIGKTRPISPDLLPTFHSTLRSIATGYLKGTSNGIQVDPDSGLVWSPSHFTWMDTNHPAATPREGYPIDIQALWIRLLRQLSALYPKETEWAALARRAESNFHDLFWLKDMGWYSDVLEAPRHVSASRAVPSTALRSNVLMPIVLGLNHHPEAPPRARKVLHAVSRHLLIPGALRSLAPLPVQPPLPVRSGDGRPLNDPTNPYWGRYEGDEDTRRKPAYHNGTAWLWTFPMYCEAMATVFPTSSTAMAAARAQLAATAGWMRTGCIGQLPEIADGDAPHTPRGCDAQAWSATEALRVLLKICPTTPS